MGIVGVDKAPELKTKAKMLFLVDNQLVTGVC